MPAKVYSTGDKIRVYQGDVFQGFKHRTVEVKDDNLEIIEIEEPFVTVVSQDCDLRWDFEYRKKETNPNQDKFISDVIIIPAYPAEQLKNGMHLERLGFTMENSWGTEKWKILEQNKNERYHFLGEDTEFGIPNLVLDFKRYYTVPREEIYKISNEKYTATINPLFRENLSRRFANFLSRIGLPE